MPIGIIQLDLYLPEVHSLKEKRHIIRPLIHHLQKKFLVSIAEVGKQDVWKNAELLVAIASSDSKQIERIKQHLTEFIETDWGEGYLTNTEMGIIIE